MSQSLLSGNPDFFFHLSLLQEASESWVLRKEKTSAGIIFMSIVRNRKEVEVCACNRTLNALLDSRHSIGFTPALLDFIRQKSAPNCENMRDDEYSLRVASLMKTIARPLYFLVSDSKKEEIIDLANKKGYKLKIISPSDFAEPYSLTL